MFDLIISEFTLVRVNPDKIIQWKKFIAFEICIILENNIKQRTVFFTGLLGLLYIWKNVSFLSCNSDFWTSHEFKKNI